MLCWFVVEKTKRASLPVLAWWQHRVLLSLERENRSAGARGRATRNSAITQRQQITPRRNAYTRHRSVE